MPWMAVAGVASSLIGGAMAQRAGAEQQASADAASARARALIGGVETPDIEKQKLDLAQYQYLGGLTPEQLETMGLGPSAMEQVNVDPLYKQKQLEALERVGQLSEEGMTPEEKSILEMSRRKAASETQAKMAQILQDRQQRGIGGSGDELAAKLAAAQQGADAQSQGDMQAAQQAMSTRRQALQQLADMSSGLRGQEYGEQSNLAKARDVISQFNVQNAQDVAKTNVSARNQALARNLETRQGLANQNVGLSNEQQLYNKELLQKDYLNRMDKAKSMAGMASDQARQYTQRAADVSKGIAETGQGVGKSLLGAAQYFKS